MNEAPIVAEVRRIREEIARRFDCDIDKMFAHLGERSRTPDPSHPLVENAEAYAKGLGTVKEEPPNEDAR